MTAARRRGLTRTERALRLVTDVRPGEGPLGTRLLAGVFLILAAYYLVKPARDGLLAVSEVSGVSETELKAYSSFGQSLVLFAVIPLYDRLTHALARRSLITWIPLFFAGNLALFWLLQPGLVFDRLPFVGIAFYLWVGIFNVSIVAQFWSFAADVYDDEAGRRLLPLIALGATSGATVGAGLAGWLVDSKVAGTFTLLLVAAAVLALSVLLLRSADTLGESENDDDAPETSGGLRLVFRHRYLFAAAVAIMLANWVNTNGENFLFGAVESRLAEVAEARRLTGAAAETFIRESTTAFYGSLFFWVNLVALFLQAFVASRLLQLGGFAAILLALPVISVTAYSTMAAVPVLAVIRLMKVAENSTDYSIHNTAKQVLWLPTTREMKYKAKAAIDTLFVRFGDGFAAVTAFLLVGMLALPQRGLFVVNALLGLVWLAVAAFVAREHSALRARRRQKAPLPKAMSSS